MQRKAGKMSVFESGKVKTVNQFFTPLPQQIKNMCLVF